MKILMFSSDPRMREEGSEVKERMERYARGLEKLEMVLLDRSRGRFLRYLKGYLEARRILVRERYHLVTAQEIEHSFLAWLLSRKFHTPWQMQIHTDVFSPSFRQKSLANKIRVWIAKFLIPRADCIRVVSRRIKESLDLRFGIRDLKIMVLPIFSALDTRYPLRNVREKYRNFEFIILMVSRLAREKNIPLALEGFREVAKKYPKTLLVIVGDGPERKNLEFRIKNYELGNNVRLEGGWPKNLSEYYRAADCFLLTSNYEGYGLVVVEALMYGLPVVMTDVGIAGEIVKNEENGIIVKVGDREGVAMGIETLIRDPAFRKKLSYQARNTPLSYHSFEEYRQKLLASWQTCRK